MCIREKTLGIPLLPGRAPYIYSHCHTFFVIYVTNYSSLPDPNKGKPYAKLCFVDLVSFMLRKHCMYNIYVYSSERILLGNWLINYFTGVVYHHPIIVHIPHNGLIFFYLIFLCFQLVILQEDHKVRFVCWRIPSSTSHISYIL